MSMSPEDKAEVAWQRLEELEAQVADIGAWHSMATQLDDLRARVASRDQRIRELTEAAQAVVEGSRDPWVAINALQALLENMGAQDAALAQEVLPLDAAS